jgi:hypothetical protein
MNKTFNLSAWLIRHDTIFFSHSKATNNTFQSDFSAKQTPPATWTGRDGKSVGAVFSHEADGMQASVIPRLGRDHVFSVR